MSTVGRVIAAGSSNSPISVQPNAGLPVMRKGKLVRTELRYNDRLAIALLGGRNGGSVTELREQAASRRRYRQFLADHDAAQAAAKRAEEEAAAAYQAELDAMLEKARQMRGPRIRFL